MEGFGMDVIPVPFRDAYALVEAFIVQLQMFTGRVNVKIIFLINNEQF